MMALAQARGYVLAYRIGSQMRCPSCAKQNWLVGRTTAECAFCHSALPIVSDGQLP